MFGGESWSSLGRALCVAGAHLMAHRAVVSIRLVVGGRARAWCVAGRRRGTIARHMSPRLMRRFVGSGSRGAESMTQLSIGAIGSTGTNVRVAGVRIAGCSSLPATSRPIMWWRSLMVVAATSRTCGFVARWHGLVHRVVVTG